MLLRIDWPANNRVMGTLTLARHGQASFGAANYDQLSDRGHLQSERLGAYYATQGSPFDVVYHGSLTRHLETWAGIQRHLKATALPVHCRPGLNEFDGNAIVTAYQAAHDLPPVAASDYKAYFRLLRNGLGAWMAAEIEPAGMGTYANFRTGVLAVMADSSRSPSQTGSGRDQRWPDINGGRRGVGDARSQDGGHQLPNSQHSCHHIQRHTKRLAVIGVQCDAAPGSAKRYRAVHFRLTAQGCGR